MLHGQQIGDAAVVERAVPQGPVADVDVVPVQRRDVENVPAVGEVRGRGVPEPGTVGGEHDLPVHRAQPLHCVPVSRKAYSDSSLPGKRIAATWPGVRDPPSKTNRTSPEQCVPG
ncbi:hypothetical protein [Streptomyces sp. NPDC059906]|uniref:hypothetical protein n=1 Tax=Streptomyces sp. NPDC059906 TaxID=3346997 RepID=UPI0036583B78